MNKAQKQAITFQAKHKARKQIDFSLAQAENGNPYWKKFYNPLNDFLGLCNKRELTFLLASGNKDLNGIRFFCEENTKTQIGEAILMKIQFKNNSHPDQQEWFKALQNRCYFVCENGQDIKI